MLPGEHIGMDSTVTCFSDDLGRCPYRFWLCTFKVKLSFLRIKSGERISIISV